MNQTNLTPENVFFADNDVRYVPSSGAMDFCALAHESRYHWLINKFNLSEKKILDFGCGSGYGTFLISNYAEEIYGIDYSISAVEFAKLHYQKRNTEFFVTDATSEEAVFKIFEKKYFDFIVSFDVIEHIEQYRSYLSIATDLIDDSGTLIIGCPNRLQTLNWNKDWNPFHKREFSPEEFRILLEGFFDEVTLISQDFHDEIKREEARSSNYLSEETQKKTIYNIEDIHFEVEAPKSHIDQAFGLIAICKKAKQKKLRKEYEEKSLKILLIEPKYSYEEALPWIPIGKGYLASVLRENGFDVEIVDNALKKYTDDELIKIIKNLQPNIIGTGGMTLQLEDTNRIAELVRKNFNTDILLVGGGVHFTLQPNDSINLFDVVVIGEGELTFLELCKKYTESNKRNEIFQTIPGLLFSDESGKIYKTDEREKIKDLDILPFPAYDLLNVREYKDFMITGEKAISIMSGRGCPYDCEFCASPKLSGRKVRDFSVQYTIELIEFLRRTYGFENFRIMDDAFTLNKTRVKEFCEEIINRKMNLNFACLTHVQASEREMFLLMKKAGFSTVAFGIESGNDDILKLINKKMNKEKAVKAIQIARDAGMIVEGLFMIGNIGENESTINDSINFAMQYNPAYTGSERTGYNWFQFATPFPGSRFFDEADLYGEVLTKDFTQYTHQIPVFVPGGLDKNKMIALREVALSETNSISSQKSYQTTRFTKDKKLNVLHVGWGHPPQYGAGPIYYLQNLCLQQQADGLSVACFVAGIEEGKGSKPSLNTKIYDGVTYNIVENRPAHYFDWNNPAREIQNLDIEKLFLETLLETPPQVVHFHNLVGLSMSLPEIAKKYGCKTVFSAHNYWMVCTRDDLFATNETICSGPGDGAHCATCVNNEQLNIDYMLRTEISRKIFAQSIDTVIAVSEKVKSIFVNFGVEEEKIIVQHIGSKAAAENWNNHKDKMFDPENENEEIIFGFLGTVMARKGIHVILEAADKLSQKTENFEIRIYGHCPSESYQKRINKLIEQNPLLQKQVKLLGGYSQNQLEKITRTIDVAIIPPIWEDNAPQTVMETLAAGLPVIGSNIGGIPDFVKHKLNGLLFQAGNSDELCACMLEIINNRNYLNTFSKNILAPKTMPEHSEELIKMYSELLESESDIQVNKSIFQWDAFECRRNIELAERFINQNDHSSALSKLHNIIKNEPANIDALNDLTVVLILKEQYEKALEILKHILNIDEKNSIAVNNLKYLKEKFEELKNSPEPELVEGNDEYQTLIEAEKLIEQNKLEEAASKLKFLIQRNEKNIDALNDLSVVYILQKKYSEAFELLKSIISIDPGNEVAAENIIYLKSLLSGSIDTVSINKFTSQLDYKNFILQHKSKYDARYQLQMSYVKDENPFYYHGNCIVCNKETDFLVDYMFAGEIDSVKIPCWRERIICPDCNMNSRMRAFIHFVKKEINPAADSKIYLTEQKTSMFNYFSKNFKNTTGSEYLGSDIPNGSSNSEDIRNEDIMNLSFMDEEFDFIFSLDVLEHVPDFQKAFNELFRLLKPNGTLVFSAPFAMESSHNIIRAVNEDGNIKHIFPPEYHGDPISSQGCLCYRYYGWELVEKLKELSFTDVAAFEVYSEKFGYLGNDNIFFVARKPELLTKEKSYKETKEFVYDK